MNVEASDEIETIRCVVMRITYANEENGWTVLKVKATGFSELVAVVGNLGSVNVGSVLSIRGKWTTDPKYGRQFSAAGYEETLPATVLGIEKYLGSGLIKGVGPKFAKRIVKTFGEKTLDVIEETPERLGEVPGIGQARVDMIIEAWKEQKAESAIDDLLASKELILEPPDSLYITPLFFSENVTARRILAIMSCASSMRQNPDEIAGKIKEIEAADGICYDAIQKEAITTAATSKIMILTGGPGTGKTTTVKGILEVFKAAGMRILLAAPTGRAAKRLPDYFKVTSSAIQVLCPMQRGDNGAQKLNSVLQAALNKSKKAVYRGGIQFRQGDKVMQVRNNYDKEVFNGDIGIIVNADETERTIEVSFDGGKPVLYNTTQLDELVLAYATTVHKAQGSEYDIVVLPLTMQHYKMLQRNLLYTGITRARKAVVLVGSKKAIKIAISNDQVAQRNTGLAMRLSKASENGRFLHL